LAEDQSLNDILGTVKHIESAAAKSLQDQVKVYIDSKDKGLDEAEQAMEYWPLVKVVKVFAKSEILQMGLVLVDLVCFESLETVRPHSETNTTN